MNKLERGELTMVPDLTLNNYLIKEKEIKDNNGNLLANIKTLFELWNFKKYMKKLDYNNIITINKDILNGKPVIKGTRISPNNIYSYYVLYCHNHDLDFKNFVLEIKEQYPSLKNKNDKTILMSLLYCIANENIFDFIKNIK